MEGTKIIGIVVALTVGVILTGSLLFPVLNDAQETAGDVETIVNSSSTHNSYQMGLVTNETIVVKVSGGALYLNGETVPISHAGTVGSIAESDVGYVGVRNNGASLYFFEYTETGLETHAINPDVEVTITATSISYSTDSFTATKVYSIGSNAPVKYQTAFNNSGSGPIYINSVDQVFGWGVFTSGEVSQLIAFSGDSATSASYPVTVEYTTEKVDGYTDLYKLTSYSVTFNDGSSNVPSMLIPVSVQAHEASGAIFSLYGAIGVVVIVALVMVAIGAIVIRRQ